MSTRNAALASRPGASGRHVDKITAASGASNTTGNNTGNNTNNTAGNRRRLNSQSQGTSASLFVAPEPLRPKSKPPAGAGHPPTRHQAEFYVTLSLLNDTFATKHVHVPYFPDMCKLGRPTGTKVKPLVTNGYFDSRVLSRNHACMYVDPALGLLMVQDMGLLNGTFVNSAKLAAEPVCVLVGDTINLGFNIQVETNHKQISARIDSINVVANTPQGAVLEVLPRLSRLAMALFSDADMHHYEFLQGLCAQLAPEPAHEPAPAAFEHGMFADIVPSLDEMFETSAGQRLDDAGIYRNSGIAVAPELLSTLDFLGASLAKTKQQGSVLASLEAFFASYTKRVDDINSRHVQETVLAREKEQHAKWLAESAQAGQQLRDQEAKLAVQARLLGSLEAELARLKGHAQTSDHHAPGTQEDEPKRGERRVDSLAAVEDMGANGRLSHACSMECGREQHPQTVSGGKESRDQTVAPFLQSQRPSTDASCVKALSPADIDSLEIGAPVVSSTVDCANAPLLPVVLDGAGDIPGQGETRTVPASHLHVPSQLKPYMDQLHHALGPYKNQGVMVGFFVVIVGFIYQSSSKTV